jgi:transcriptional regulator with XRE-family HTH domain
VAGNETWGEDCAVTKETGALVQKLRLQRGWSQEQLAELCTLSVRTIQRIERGQTASLETLTALASVFEIDVATLMEPEMDKPSKPGISTEEALALAHVRKLKGFYLHLVQYVVVIAILAVLNFVLYPRNIWVGWVALGWGSGVLVHGLRTFDKVPFLTAGWEARQVERYLGRKL